MTEAANLIIASRPGFEPKIAVILGSGMGEMAGDVREPMAISYGHLPQFPKLSVDGHAGKLITGYIGSTPVIVLQGRAHYYEHGEAAIMKPAIQSLHALGVQSLIATNAAGSLDPKMGAGSVMMIADHINLVQTSPLIGEIGNRRFVDMVGAYDAGLKALAREAASSVGRTLFEGIYVWFAGPQFETPAEIRMARAIGGHAVGMSTVPEIILARYLGMRAAAFSIITNLGAGMSEDALSHENTMHNANVAAVDLRAILCHMIAGMPS